MEAGPHLGSLITDGERRRDAIHIAVAPVTAAVPLLPGDHVGFIDDDTRELVAPMDDAIGIIDPFLIGSVEPGERCWMFLYPNTITSLRHVWTHPAYQPKVPPKVS